MGLAQIISKVALETANHFSGNTDLLDAVVEMDNRTILYLLNNKYSNTASKYGYNKNRITHTSINPVDVLKALETDMRDTSGIVVI